MALLWTEDDDDGNESRPVLLLLYFDCWICADGACCRYNRELTSKTGFEEFGTLYATTGLNEL